MIVRTDPARCAFDRSIHPYRAGRRGDVRSFARPSRGFSEVFPGLDFEHRLFAAQGAAEILERELASDEYWAAPAVSGVQADPYPPVERQHRITRSLLEVLCRAHHPLCIITKSNLILRDLDILSAMARDDLVKVFISVATLDRQVARQMEPRAPTPNKRLEAIEALNDAGVPTGVTVSPIIPAINDGEIEAILTRAYQSGAREAAYVVTRMPRALRDPFRERVLAHYPDKLRRAAALLQSMYEGRDGEARPGHRGEGATLYAWMVGGRFETAARRLGYHETLRALRADLFRKPTGVQREDEK